MRPPESIGSKFARAAMWVSFAAFVMGGVITYIEGTVPEMIPETVMALISGEAAPADLPGSINLMFFGAIGFVIAAFFCEDRFWQFWRGRERRR